MFILNIRALGAGITFCGVGEVQTLLFKKKKKKIILEKVYH